MGATKPHTESRKLSRGRHVTLRNKPAGPGVVAHDFNPSRRILSLREFEASLVYSMPEGTKGSENRGVEGAGGQGRKAVLAENIRVQDRTQGWG